MAPIVLMFGLFSGSGAIVCPGRRAEKGRDFRYRVAELSGPDAGAREELPLKLGSTAFLACEPPCIFTEPRVGYRMAMPERRRAGPL